MAPLEPLIAHRAVVRPEWVDRNGHFNIGYYMVLFDEATDAFLDRCGLTSEYRLANQIGTFAVESHATYERELVENDRIVEIRLLLARADVDRQSQRYRERECGRQNRGMH